MTWKYGVLGKFNESQLRGHLPSLIRNFLSNRKIRAKVENKYSEEYNIIGGIPIGRVLWCICFALSINICLTNLPYGVKSTLYVDDLMIYYSGKKTRTIERILQLATKRNLRNGVMKLNSNFHHLNHSNHSNHSSHLFNLHSVYTKLMNNTENRTLLHRLSHESNVKLLGQPTLN